MATAAEKSEYPDVEELVASKEIMTHPNWSSTNEDIYYFKDQAVKKPRMKEIDKFIQLVEEEKPKIEKDLAELVKNHNELDAGQKTSIVVKGLMLGVSIIATAFFLDGVVNAATTSIAKAKNSRAAKTAKRQEQLWSNIESKMCNLNDNIPSTVASDQVASVRRSNGAVLFERILKVVNDLPSADLVYSIIYDDSEGYEYKSDIPKLLKNIKSELAALEDICNYLKDIKTVNLPSETRQSLSKTETKLVDVNNATRSIAAESKAANQFDSVKQFQKSNEAFIDHLFESFFLVKLEEQGGYKYKSKIEKLDEAITIFFENCIEKETCSQCGARIS